MGKLIHHAYKLIFTRYWSMAGTGFSYMKVRRKRIFGSFHGHHHYKERIVSMFDPIVGTTVPFTNFRPEGILIYNHMYPKTKKDYELQRKFYDRKVKGLERAVEREKKEAALQEEMERMKEYEETCLSDSTD
ncbi:hypothetical protein RF11_06255 [Thelohanellus kitauei]|uniref:Uncharacterized protein n=1 Tax=Thelohanellus kitauei TaxID=669202 RepID=A0A0C2JZC4_THEKT|nr:hypothetical protein RF11_06255 [Thelohanellus kitauei]